MHSMSPMNASFRYLAKTCLLIGLAAFLMLPAGALAADKTWTDDADFDEGVLDSVNHDAPNNDQLQLDESVTSTFPVLWVANAGEDTVSKIDTDTDTEIARYCTGFFSTGQQGCTTTHGAWEGPAPSRTAVDGDGNVYVANRQFDFSRPAEVVKILAEGGIDRDGSNTIETSTSSTPMTATDANSNGLLDCDATTCESTDERIAWSVPVGAVDSWGRSLCIGTDGNIWVGTYMDSMYYKISSADGSLLAGPIDVSPNDPYGCLVDGNGTLWGASLDDQLLELNTNTETVVAVRTNTWDDYGIALANDKVYLGNLDGRTVTVYDPANQTFTDPAPISLTTLGISADGDGNILLGASIGGTVAKLAGDGSVIWSVAQQSGPTEIRGVAVDSNGDLWTIRRADNSVAKYAGADGSHLGVFPLGDEPYTYSDATGLGFRSTTDPFGTWTGIYDSGLAAMPWGTVSWTTIVPTDASLTVRARAAESEGGLGIKGYIDVESGVPFSDTGRFVQVQARLEANDSNESPVLFDLTVATEICTGVCGDPNLTGTITAVDAQWILHGAVGNVDCPLCVCDVNTSLDVLADDALRTLLFAIGLVDELTCPEDS